MPISVTQLRANIYNIVDDIIRTGRPVDIERGGVTLRMMAISGKQASNTKKLDRLISRPHVMAHAPEDYVHVDWSHEWKP